MESSVYEGYTVQILCVKLINLVDDGHVEVIELRISPEDMPQFLLTRGIPSSHTHNINGVRLAALTYNLWKVGPFTSQLTYQGVQFMQTYTVSNNIVTLYYNYQSIIIMMKG